MTLQSLRNQAAAEIACFTLKGPLIDKEEGHPSERFERLDLTVRCGLRIWTDVGIALLEIREKELWRDGGYKNWNHYCASLLETTRSYINRIIGHAIIVRELWEHKLPFDFRGEEILPVAEAQTRPLKKLPESKLRAKAWRLAVKRAEGLPTAKIVTEVVGELVGAVPAREKSSRQAQRLELITCLLEAAESKDSWDRVVALVNRLDLLESSKNKQS